MTYCLDGACRRNYGVRLATTKYKLAHRNFTPIIHREHVAQSDLSIGDSLCADGVLRLKASLDCHNRLNCAVPARKLFSR